MQNRLSTDLVGRTKVLCAANIAAVLIYLLAASTGWVERVAADTPGAAGGGAVLWFLLAVPVVLLSFFANMVVAVKSLKHRYQTGQRYVLWSAWIAVPGLWALAMALDFSLHGS